MQRIVLDPRFIGNAKDQKRIDEAKKTITASVLLEPSSIEECEELLQQGLALYESLFPNPDERESARLIRKRLSNESFCRSCKGCFDILIKTNDGGQVISWHQFSSLPLESGSAIAYMQYTGCSTDEYMKQIYGRNESLHGHGIYTYNTAVMLQITDERARQCLGCAQGVKGYILESEMIGQALTDEEIRYTKERLLIHERTGAKAIMLRMPDGSLLSPHYQPALGHESDATKLLILYRPVQYDASKNQNIECIDKSSAHELVMAFINNFDAEEFDKEAVEYARKHIQECFDRGTEALLIPPTQTPDIVQLSMADDVLRKFLFRDYGDTSRHALRISNALTAV